MHTPSGLKTDDAAVRGALMKALGGAVRMFDLAGVAPDAALGALQYVDSGHGMVPVPGGEEFEGVLNKLESHQVSAGHYQPYFGTSYVQFISLQPRSVSASGILSYSQSTDPRSPYYLNQLSAFSRGEVFRLPEPDNIPGWHHK